MARRVFKYKVPLAAGAAVIEAHAVSNVLHCAMQDGDPHIWIEIDDAKPNLRAAFEVFGTGHPVPAYATHAGTVMHGQYVWHVYQTKYWERIT